MKKCKGFSLSEVLFAVALLGLVGMFLLNIFPSSMISLRQSEQRLQASVLAQSVLDECSSRSFKSLTPGAYSVASPGPYTFLQDKILGDLTVLHPTLEVSVLATPPGVKKVRTTISWDIRGKHSDYVQELRLCDLNR